MTLTEFVNMSLAKKRYGTEDKEAQAYLDERRKRVAQLKKIFDAGEQALKRKTASDTPARKQ